MNSAHASLLQWLQAQPKGPTLRIIPPTKHTAFWAVDVGLKGGIGESYEAACHDLLQQLK